MADAKRAFQFDDLAQQRDAANLGMWIFLVTEVMFFGGLFASYAIYRLAYPESFAEGSHHLYMSIGSINTAILLTSSLTMALAVHAASEGRQRPLFLFLLTTAGLGGVFLALKGLEYYLDVGEHVVPGFSYDPSKFAHPDHTAIFFVIYIIMTGLHALHVTVGVVTILVVSVMARRRRFTPENYNIVENVGLYWHFVDIVWIFLLPLLYLAA